MKLQRIATALALTVALAAPVMSHAQGRSSRSTSYRPPSAVVRQSTVAVGRPTSGQASFHYNRLAVNQLGFAQKNDERLKAQYGSTNGLLDRTVSTVLGRHSRFGFTNGAGSLLASRSTNPYTQRSLSNLGSNIAGTAVKAKDMIRHLGNLLKRP